MHVDTDTYAGPVTSLTRSGRPIASGSPTPSSCRAICTRHFVYSLEQGKTIQLTDGMSERVYAAFDKDGKYLYFTASTDIGIERRLARHVEPSSGR